jgi:nucleoside-diphosphate-sugar epimerase
MSRHLAVVAGGGGFIGGHLVASLLGQGYAARAVDVKPLAEWYQVHRGADNVVSDLRLIENCERASAGAERVFQLVADMGGMGSIGHNKALCMLSVLTNTRMLLAARRAGVHRFFYSSSECVYNADKQRTRTWWR